MKTGKIKILFAAIALLCAAMPAMAQFRYGALLGANLNDLKFKQVLAPVSQIGGVQAGVQAELMFPGIGFGLDLGLLYNMEGASVNLGDKTLWASQGYGKETLLLHRVTIPFHLRFKWTRLNGLEDVIAPFVYGGPDFNIALGHSKCDAIDFSGGDLSLCVGFGVELWRNWQVSAVRSWGMTYALKTVLLQDYSARTRQWSLRLTHFF